MIAQNILAILILLVLAAGFIWLCKKTAETDWED